jgi:hypothetical protein
MGKQQAGQAWQQQQCCYHLLSNLRKKSRLKWFSYVTASHF